MITRKASIDLKVIISNELWGDMGLLGKFYSDYLLNRLVKSIVRGGDAKKDAIE